ncbi:MAG: precorrin-6A reductase [Methanosphaera sp.]|nr:precorrin-6A reductase [Methanosphaera sp.]
MRYIVMSGTSDSTKVIKYLDNKENYIIATTVTDYGADIAKNAGADKVISKPLKQEDFVSLIKENNIDTLIDATHPFASVATDTAIKSCNETGINYIRYERASTVLPETDLIHKVESFEKAAILANEMLGSDDKLMHLAGVMTLGDITEKVDPNKIIVRVLPNTFSISKTQKTGIKASNIIAMQGTFSKEFNKSLMKEYNVSIVLTKESGESGGAEEKINAALDLGIPIILVTRPVVEGLDQYPIVRSIEELDEIL